MAQRNMRMHLVKLDNHNQILCELSMYTPKATGSSTILQWTGRGSLCTLVHIGASVRGITTTGACIFVSGFIDRCSSVN
jgi:hypothetical protein